MLKIISFYNFCLIKIKTKKKLKNSREFFEVRSFSGNNVEIARSFSQIFIFSLKTTVNRRLNVKICF